MLRLQNATGIYEQIIGITRPVQAGEIIAFQSQTTANYLMELLSLWLQGGISLTLDPKLPQTTVRELMLQEDIQNLLTAEQLHHPSGIPLPQNIKEDQPVTLIRTSGSTGEPKLAQHSWGNHFWSAQGSQQNIPLDKKHTWLLSLPLYHVGGLAIVIRCWLAGAILQLPEPEQSLTEAVLNYKPSHLSLVPTQLQRLMRHKKTVLVLKKCQAILLGGAPMSADLMAEAIHHKLPVFTSYGSTEMSSQITTTSVGYWQSAPSNNNGIIASGKLLPFRELRLHQHEIQVRGKTLFQGYRKQGKLHLPLTSTGWFCTRDTGHFEQGQLKVTGRLDHQFISGGENIQPEEIERSILSLSSPQIKLQNIMVVPVPNAEFGECPVAFVCFKTNINEDDFLRWQRYITQELQKILPRFKHPQVYFLWPDPDASNATLKPNRQKMKVLAHTLLMSSSIENLK